MTQDDDLPQNMKTLEDFEELVELLRNRGDILLGQYIADVMEDYFEDSATNIKATDLAMMSATTMLDAVKEHESDDEEEKPDVDTECVACGDGVDSADELQEILENKGGE